MESIKDKINNLFKELDFEIRNINGDEYYFKNNFYYKMEYWNEANSYILEYAESYDDVCNNLFLDSDIYNLDCNENDFIKRLYNDLIKYYK
ncbi:hypothetical protein FACS1894172_21790 [Spirochaetia bacterium]|nr:hypothetical protein FACS1894164_05280 [Spirochaetia bacterium]GHU38323.1 hypothetical protein FACS1894172_21790 [Spirochaetia bacterium]